MNASYTFKRIWEKWYPQILSMALVVVLMQYFGSSFHAKVTTALIKNAPNSITIATVLFGFLFGVLTLLASLSNSKVMEMLRKAKRTKDLLRYNRQAVYSSGITSLMALLLTFMEAPTCIVENLEGWFWWVLPRLWLYMAFWMLLTTYRYVRLFYRILEVDEVWGTVS